jgi:hypothetical protein
VSDIAARLVAADLVRGLHPNVVRAMAASDYPHISVPLLGGGEIYYSDMIAAAEIAWAERQEREAAIE